MARYIQRIALLGKERWIGWEMQSRFREWEQAGRVKVIGADECYLRILGRLA